MIERKHPCALCEQCTLNTPRARYVPSKRVEGAELIVVGEAPGEEEAFQGEPFVGKSGVLLAQAVENFLGRDPNKISKLNVVACRPPNNRDPLPKEIAACTPRLLADLEDAVRVADMRAHVVGVGRFAGDTLLKESGNDPKLDFATRRVSTLDWKGGALDGVALNFAYHPAFILRKQGELKAWVRDLERAYGGKKTHPVSTPPEYEVVASTDRLKALLDGVVDGTPVAFDLETEHLLWYDTPQQPAAKILMLALAWSYTQAIIIGPELLQNQVSAGMLSDFFARVHTVAHNGKFDVRFLLHQTKVRATCDHDTLIMHYVLDETPGTHDLKVLAAQYFNVPDYETEHVKKYLKKGKAKNYGDIPFEHLAQYAAWDVTCTLALFDRFQQDLKTEGLWEWPYLNVDMRKAHALTKVEMSGIRVDIPYLQMKVEEMEKEMDALTQKMRTMCNLPDLNPRSPQQLAHALYDVLGLELPRNARCKPRSTDVDAMALLEGQHSMLDVLKQYRRIHKMKTSYIDNLFKYADVNGRVHGDALVHGTEIGRISYRNPALQTIPRAGDKYGRIIRSSFIADPGYTLVIVDLASAEMRVLAALSGETFLLELFARKESMHKKVALAMFGEGYTKEQYTNCKSFNFAWQYGGNEHSFSQSAGLPLDMARQFVRDYEQQMPHAVQWKKTQFVFAQKHGYVQSRFGRKRRFPIVNDYSVNDDIRKASVHAVISGSASDITLLTVADLVDMGIDVKLTVHDSIIVQCRPLNAEIIGEVIKDTMMRNCERWFPEVVWDCDVDIQERWELPIEMMEQEQGVTV